MPICACSVHPVLLCGWLLGCWSQWFLLHLLSLACEPLPLSPISPHLKITSSLSFLHPCSSSTSTSQENCHRAAKHRERETPPRIRSYRDVCWSSDLQWRCSKSLCWLHGSAHSIELMKRSLSGTHWSARLYSSVLCFFAPAPLPSTLPSPPLHFLLLYTSKHTDAGPHTHTITQALA